MNAVEILAAVFPRILELSIQAAVLALLVLSAQALLGPKLAPAWRHGLWLLVVLRLIVPVSPESSWSLYNYLDLRLPGLEKAEPVPSAIAFDSASDRESFEGTDGLIFTTVESSVPALKERRSLTPRAAIGANQVEGDEASWGSAGTVWRLCAILWCVGAMGFALKLAWDYARFKRALAGAKPMKNPDALEAFQTARRWSGTMASIPVLESGAVQSPALMGFWKGRLLIPATMADRFSKDELRHIFLHELAHWKRGDLQINWITTALLALNWFNPMLWFALHRMRADRELAADALALQYAGESESKPYGETLVKLLEQSSGPASIPGMVGILENNAQIKNRLRRIIRYKKSTRWSLLALIPVVLMALVAMTGAVGQDEKATEANVVAGEPKIRDTQSFPPSTDAILSLDIRVHDSDQKPIDRFHVGYGLVRNPSSRHLAVEWVDEFMEQGREGSYQLSINKPAPAYVVRIAADGYREIQSRPLIPPVPAEKAFGFVLLKGRVIDGHVYSPNGKPAADAQITILPWSSTQSHAKLGSIFFFRKAPIPFSLNQGRLQAHSQWEEQYVAESDEDGGFTTQALPERLYGLVAVHPEGFAFLLSHQLTALFRSNPSKDLSVRLEPWGAIEGELKLKGKPLANERIVLTRNEDVYRLGVEPRHYQTRTDANGEFSFEKLPPFHMRVSHLVTHPNGETEIARISHLTGVKSGERKRVSLEGGGATLVGKAVMRLTADRRAKLPSIALLSPSAEEPDQELIALNYLYYRFETFLDSNGEFAFEDVPPGAYQLYLPFDGIKRTIQVPEVSNPNIPQRIDLGVLAADNDGAAPAESIMRNPGGRNGKQMRISAVDAENGSPVGSFKLHAFYVKRRSLQGIEWEERKTYERVQARYEFELTEEKPYLFLAAEAEDYEIVFSEAIQANSPGDYEFQLKRGLTLSGVVYQPDGSPAAGAQVGLITDTGFTLSRGRLDGKSVSSQLYLTEADGNGRFKFRPSTNPRGIVSVHENGYRLLDFEKDESPADSGTGERMIRLQEWAAVEGRLVLDGKPAGDQEVRAIWPPEPVSDLYFKLFGFGSNFGDTTNNDGRFKIDKLFAGTYRVAQIVPGPKISDAFTGVGMPNQLIAVDLNSGDTARVTLGGEGRPVVGNVVLSDPQRQIDWTLYMAVLHGIPNPSKDPSKSAAGQIASSMMDDQGGFRMSDVIAGEYQLVINLKQDPKVSRYGFSTEQQNIGSLKKTIVVEADPNGYPGSPMDLGTLTVPVDD